MATVYDEPIGRIHKSHNAPVPYPQCTNENRSVHFLFLMVYCGILDRCIVGLVRSMVLVAWSPTPWMKMLGHHNPGSFYSVIVGEKRTELGPVSTTVWPTKVFIHQAFRRLIIIFGVRIFPTYWILVGVVVYLLPSCRSDFKPIWRH